MSFDVVDFFKKQVDIWNDDEKCGFCWEFSSPLFESASNVQQTREKCCTYLFLTDIETSESPRFSANTNLKNAYTCDTTFTLSVVRKGNLGTNNYNEIPNHPIDESLWETIYKPLADCFECEFLLDFCVIVGGVKIDIVNWKKTMERAYLDNNYFGWKIRATFRMEN